MSLPSLPVQSFGWFWIAISTLAVLLLFYWHYRKDHFDVRDAITSPGTDGIRRVDTSKSILVGAFLVSSYWITENYSETALGLYLGAWVINGGAVLLQKVLIKPQQDTQSSTTTVTTQSKVTP